MHRRGVAEAHLDLGRMHVDIDAARVDVEVQAVHRLAAGVQHVGVSGAHRVREHSVAHKPSVDEEILRIATRASGGRRRDPAVQVHAGDVGIDLALGRRELVGHQAQRALARSFGRQREQCASLVNDRERDRGLSRSDALDLSEAMRELGRFRAQEFAARRCPVEHIGHFDARSRRTAPPAAARRRRRCTSRALNRGCAR